MRLHLAWTDASGRSREIQRAQLIRAVREAVDHLVDPTAGNGVRRNDDGGGRIAVVRGWDSGGRAIKDTVAAAGERRAWQILDLPTVPGFGRIPLADDVRLVVAASTSLVPLAQRCAGFWNCCLLDPTITPSDPQTFAFQAASALSVVTSGRLRDVVTSRWEITGEFSYRGQVGPEVSATALGIEPSGAGLLFDHVVHGRRESAQLTGTSISLRLDGPTHGTIDGHPDVFPAGRYTFVPNESQFHRVVGPEAQR